MREEKMFRKLERIYLAGQYDEQRALLDFLVGKLRTQVLDTIALGEGMGEFELGLATMLLGDDFERSTETAIQQSNYGAYEMASIFLRRAKQDWHYITITSPGAYDGLDHTLDLVERRIVESYPPGRHISDSPEGMEFRTILRRAHGN
ncbi:MAG: hypothetical protein ACE5ES_05180 [Candidatus Nanoarchaeia archaeon]